MEKQLPPSTVIRIAYFDKLRKTLKDEYGALTLQIIAECNARNFVVPLNRHARNALSSKFKVKIPNIAV